MATFLNGSMMGISTAGNNISPKLDQSTPDLFGAPGIWTPADINRKLLLAATGANTWSMPLFEEWPTVGSDPNYSTVTFLCHVDRMTSGANISDLENSAQTTGNTNAIVSCSPIGGANISRTTKTPPFGQYAISINTGYGATPYYQLPVGATGLNMGTGDFTIEFWLLENSTGLTASLWDFRTSGTSICPSIGLTSGKLYYFVNGVIQIQDAAAFTLNLWQHVAVCRVGGNTKMFKGGVQVGSTYADANNYTSSGAAIGNNSVFNGIGNAPANTALFTELRINVGHGYYSANFTPSVYRFPNY